MNQHIAIIVSGKVQGVFFRAATKEKADELGVMGFVRNEPSGNVCIEAEATEDVLAEFVKWCNIGPLRAHVQDVKVIQYELKGFKSFDVQR